MSKALLAILLLLLSPVSSAESGNDQKETIVIRADRAWEEPDEREVLHFQGNFELISPDWTLYADEADLYGPLDDPHRLVARGAPALLTILDREERVIGRGEIIEYVRETDIITLTGNAELEGDSLSMKSAEIVYDVGEERLKSSASSGVEMILQRDRL